MNTIVITGASDGIGKAIAYAFSKRKFKIGLVARRIDLLNTVSDECKRLGAENVFVEAVDVTHHDQFRQSLSSLESKLGGVEIFIANAGIGLKASPRDDSYDIVHKVISVNTLAAIDGLEFFKGRMIKRGRGTLVGVSSVAGARGLPSMAPYSASKAALGVYLESVRGETYSQGLRVVDIAPGFIDTEMTKKNKFWMPFLMPVERAGEIFCRDILKGRSHSIAPRIYSVARYLLRVMPDGVFDFFTRRMK